MTLTFCTAIALVVAARPSLLARRACTVTYAEHASKAGITKNRSSLFPFEREACFGSPMPEGLCSVVVEVSTCVFMLSSRILGSQGLRFFLTANHGENDWNEEESCDRGEKHPANYRAAEGRILFA